MLPDPAAAAAALELLNRAAAGSTVPSSLNPHLRYRLVIDQPQRCLLFDGRFVSCHDMPHAARWIRPLSLSPHAAAPERQQPHVQPRAERQGPELRYDGRSAERQHARESHHRPIAGELPRQVQNGFGRLEQAQAQAQAQATRH